MAEKVKLKRLRKIPYTVNFPTSNGIRTISFAGSKNGRYDIKDVDIEIFDWLTLSTTCFQEGELVVEKDSPEAEALEATLPDIEEYSNNTHAPEEIEKLLLGNTNKLKAALDKVTSSSEKREFVNAAKEHKDELTNAKLKIIAELVGVSQSTLFSEE